MYKVGSLKFITYLSVICLSACVRSQPLVIVVTNTPPAELGLVGQPTVYPQLNASTIPTTTFVPINTDIPSSVLTTYVVQSGDTLSSIADRFNLGIQSILELNLIQDPNLISVGQIILLPPEPNTTSLKYLIVPDHRFVRGPSSRDFDVKDFIELSTGFLETATDTVAGETLSAAEILQQVSQEFSVDARILLALLEYQSHWITQIPDDQNLVLYPIQGSPSSDGIDRSGLYKQLAWAANQLNEGYYGWKYRGLTTLEFSDGTRVELNDQLNAATVGIQRLFSLLYSYSDWEHSVSNNGYSILYNQLFGDPFLDVSPDQTLINIKQPELELPFAKGQTWFFTGGPHGGWGSGSAWAAIDFAPPDDRNDSSPLCYVSDYWATAVSDGVVARSGDGIVILDLDGDGDDTTGWNILYLHLSSDGIAPVGSHVSTGDHIGRPSCEGGFSTATHLHIARLYNGEWIPISCDACASSNNIIPFEMSNWTIFGLLEQEYQGYMLKGEERRDAEQGRLTPINQVTW